MAPSGSIVGLKDGKFNCTLISILGLTGAVNSELTSELTCRIAAEGD